MNAYLLTKPLKVGKTYNGHGIYSFVLQEVVSTDNDNFELGIANYYLHFPKENTSDIVDDKDLHQILERRGGCNAVRRIL